VEAQYCRAVIVSTPQDIALIGAVQGVNIFNKVHVLVCLFPYLLLDADIPIQFTRADTRNGPKHECIYMSQLPAYYPHV
jgi:hypothetical protein